MRDSLFSQWRSVVRCSSIPSNSVETRFMIFITKNYISIQIYTHHVLPFVLTNINIVSLAKHAWTYKEFVCWFIVILQCRQTQIRYTMIQKPSENMIKWSPLSQNTVQTYNILKNHSHTTINTLASDSKAILCNDCPVCSKTVYVLNSKYIAHGIDLVCGYIA